MQNLPIFFDALPNRKKSMELELEPVNAVMAKLGIATVLISFPRSDQQDYGLIYGAYTVDIQTSEGHRHFVFQRGTISWYMKVPTPEDDARFGDSIPVEAAQIEQVANSLEITIRDGRLVITKTADLHALITQLCRLVVGDSH